MTKKKSINLDQFFTASSPDSDDLNFLLGADPVETVQRAAERGLPLMHLVVSAIAPDPQQLRHLPHPFDLRRRAERGDRAATAMLKSLDELGRSLREHGQIQPVVAYPDTDPAQPEVTHRLLNGHRRWSAAMLHTIPTLWVVEVERPNEVFRLRQQFEENERREDLSDMERAWAMMALKDALQAETNETVPWNVIERQLQLSVQRRQDLLRLLRFAPDAQQLIMAHGWSEWTLRPLHMAINAGDLSQSEATDMLRVLADQNEVNGTVVENLVREYRATRTKNATTTTDSSTSESQVNRHNDRELVRQQMNRLVRGVHQLGDRVARVKAKEARNEIRAELAQLRDQLDNLLHQFD